MSFPFPAPPAPSSVVSPPADATGLLEQIRLIVRAEIAAPVRTDRILTFAEAIAYAKHGSRTAFQRWCRRWRITSGQNGRYSRSQLDRALQREAERRRLSRGGHYRRGLKARGSKLAAPSS